MWANLCTEKFFKRLFGWKDVESALNILDKLMQEEAQIAAAQILKLTLVVESYTFGHRCVSLHNESGKLKDIVGYINSRRVL
jgi:hypothetical protein